MCNLYEETENIFEEYITFDTTPFILDLDTPNNSFNDQNIRNTCLENGITPVKEILSYASDIAYFLTEISKFSLSSFVSRAFEPQYTFFYR